MSFKVFFTPMVSLKVLLFVIYVVDIMAHRLHTHEPHLIMDKSHMEERDHIIEHLDGVVESNIHINKMAEEELRFHYFKMHDNDDNNQLDGCELIKSLLHWHVEESKLTGTENSGFGTTRIFDHNELAHMIDPILKSDDKNNDGFIDYPEFVAAQKARGF